VAVVYLDTSALGRVLLGEPDAEAVLRELAPFEQRVASRVLRLELRRLGLREGMLAEADQLLSGVALLPVDEQLLAAAETLPPASVGTLDALHLATALRLAHGDRLVAII
jgi:predicted nucleic acid-binding protein